MRPHWLPHQRMEDVSELDAFLPPDPARVIHGQPTKEELEQGKSWAAILLVFVGLVAGASWIAEWLGSMLEALSS